MCNISLPSNGTGSLHPDGDGHRGTGQEVSGGKRWQRGTEALALRAPRSPGGLDRKECTSVFLCLFHQQVTQQT